MLHLFLLVSNGHQLVGSIPPEREGERESLVHVVLQLLVEFGSPSPLDVLLELVTGLESLSVTWSWARLVEGVEIWYLEPGERK